MLAGSYRNESRTGVDFVYSSALEIQASHSSNKDV